MRKDLYLERLRAVPLFAAMSKKELEQLLRQADHLRFPPRHEIVRAGSRGQEFWLVIEGQLAVRRGGETVATLSPGEYFGELAVIDGGTRDATVVTTSPVELMLIDSRHFWAALEANGTLMRKVIIGLARRLHEADERDSAAREAARLPAQTIQLSDEPSPATSR